MAKAKAFFQEKGVLGFSVAFGKQAGWRCRVKVAVRKVKKKIVIGLFKPGTHDIVSAENCSDHHPRINVALQRLHEFFDQEKIAAYDERTQEGIVRYLQCVVERRTGRVQVVIVLNTSYDTLWKRRLTSLFQDDPALWHSFWINVQSRMTNTIFSSEWHHVVGERFLKEVLCGLEVPFLPSHFVQANPEMFELLLEDAKKIFPHGQKVLELFSGMGIISCVLRQFCRSVALYEVEPSAKEAFCELFQQLPFSLQESNEFIVGDANAAHRALQEATAIIMDPPRKGVAQAMLNSIVACEEIQHLLYISCCWNTFERDTRVLTDGGFHVQWARSYLFFPGTNQLETMCLFSREAFAKGSRQ